MKLYHSPVSGNAYKVQLFLSLLGRMEIPVTAFGDATGPLPGLDTA